MHPGPQGTNENTPGAVGACVLDRLRLAPRSIYSVAACDLKPVFHCDAKKLRWALALASPQRHYFALGIPTCLYLKKRKK